MMKKKKDNKGFSLVELIVVIAIMAILAVTLAPRLMHYVDKARTASDEQVVNSILSAVQLTLTDAEMLTAFEGIAKKYNHDGGEVEYYLLDLSASDGATPPNNLYYDIAGKSWKAANDSTNEFVQELNKVITSFSLKSSSAGSASDIVIAYSTADGVISVFLDYDGVTTAIADTSTTGTGVTAANVVAKTLIDTANYSVSQ